MVKGFIEILRADTGIQALVGENKAENKYKVYPGICPQPEQFPYTVLRITSKTPFGPCKNTVVPTTWEITFNAFSYHRNYDNAEALNRAVIAALVGKEGTFEGIKIQEIRVVNAEIDDFVNEGGGLHAQISSFEAVVNENQAT